MKKIFVTIGISLLAFTCKAQNNIVDYNNIYVNTISIVTFNPSDFISTIGLPEKSTYDIGFNTDVYKKNGNRFSFFKNSNYGETDPYQAGNLISFDIMTPNVLVKINNITIKVGDNIAILKTVFPNSYNQNKRHNTLIIGFRGGINGGVWISDNSLIIKYDGFTQEIKEIHLYYSL